MFDFDDDRNENLLPLQYNILKIIKKINKQNNKDFTILIQTEEKVYLA